MAENFSFDIFDTLVTRKVGLPSHIFILTGMKACELNIFDLSPEIFAVERRNAERELLQKGKIPDIHEIYQRLELNLNLSRELSDEVLDLELDLELEYLVPIQKNVQLLRKLRNEGKKVLYISDMYLKEEFLRKMLTELDIIKKGERIFVSCEHGVNKKSGLLFDKVADELCVDKKELHHIGNCKSSDIQGAKKAGISSTYVPYGNLNRYEKVLLMDDSTLSINPEDRIYYSKMAASSRLARLTNNSYSAELYDVSTSVAAPVLYLFITSLLERTKDKMLCFLSRDGYILYEIAKIIMAEKGIEKKLRYIHISREVLVFAKMTKKPEKDLVNTVKKIFGNKTVRQVLEKLSVSDDSIRKSLLPKHSLDKKLLSVSVETLTSIFHNEYIFSDVKKDAIRRNKILLAYLKKEGLFDERDICLVDVGWNLTIHDLMAELFNVNNVPPPNGYYFGINWANSYINNGNKSGFLWDLRKNGFSFNIPRVTRLIEVFCSAPQGKTVDYQKSDGEIKPVFNDYEIEYLMNWGVSGMEDAILTFSKTMAHHKDVLKSRNLDRLLCKELVNLFWLNPTREEIKVWGNYPFFIVDEKKEFIKLYNKKPLYEIIYYIIRKNTLPKDHIDSWPFAHLHSLSPLPKRIVKLIYSTTRIIRKNPFSYIIRKVKASI